MRWRATSSDGHTGSGVYTFGVGVTPPPPTDAYGATGPTWTDDAARWAFFVALALLLGTTGLRLLVLREPLPVAALEPPLRSRRRRRHRDPQRRNRGVRDARRRRAAAALRRSALRRSLADRDEDAVRARVHRDDARVRRRHRARPPGLDPRPALAPLAVVHHRAGLRHRALPLRAPGSRTELDVPHRPRRLAPPRRGAALGRWPRRRSRVRLAAGARPFAALHSSASRASRPCSSPCSSSPGQYLSHLAPAERLRSVVDDVRADAARQARDRRRRPRLGCRPSLRRPAAPRAGRRSARTATQPDRRELRRHPRARSSPQCS